MILFLDFDGVLHPDPCFERQRLFEQAPLLDQTLAPLPEVRIVFSTAWRTLVEHEELLAYLPEGLRPRVLGATPIFGQFRPVASLMPFRRQAECLQWLCDQGRNGGNWLALDDRPAGFMPHCEQLIDCHPAIGFDRQAAGRLASAVLRSRRGSYSRVPPDPQMA